MTIVEFLNARLNEEEQEVRANTPLNEAARELWKIDANRKILAEYSTTGGEGVGRIVAVLADVYRDHPDYAAIE